MVGLLLAATACSSVRSDQASVPGEPSTPPSSKPSTPPSPKPGARDAEVFDSRDFVVVVAKPGDTAEGLAARYLGDPKKKWMIEDYMGVRTFSEGQEVVIPKREWNPGGVFPWGYQLVPVLVYHRISAENEGKLSIGVRHFEAQMRSLHAEGFRAVSLGDFLEFTAGRRQLPRKSVVLTFDDGHRSFIQYARPLLKDFGFNATLFVYSDFIGAGSGLSWSDLRALISQGFDVQAHSKTHGNLRRKEDESQAAYAKRLESELAYPLDLLRKHLGRAVDTLAYPYGDTDEEVLRHVVKYGYVAAFTVRRQSNPAFVFPLKISRSQIYSEMTPKDFARNLIVFQDEEVGTARTSDGKLAGSSGAARVQPVATAAAAPPVPWARDLEGRIGQEVAGLLKEGRALLGRGLLGEAQQRFLVALSLDPTNRTAFETLQNEVREVMSIVHTVRSGDTCPSLAELYYGDRLRCEVIAETNRLALNVPLRPGQKLKIPEIPGVPFQLR